MAKTSYLNLTNIVLRRITQSTVTTIVGASGHALIISNLINEAQKVIYMEHDEWYSLFKLRTFQVIPYTAATISFADANPDTIDDSANGFGNLEAATQVLVSNSSSNDGIYRISTAAAGQLVLQTSDSLTVEAASTSITITPITKLVASDFGRSISLSDVTNNRIVRESFNRSLDELDPDSDTTGPPERFVYQDAAYRMFPIASGTVKFTDRYYALPTDLTTDAETSDLPIEAEPAIIQWAWAEMSMYLSKLEQANAGFVKYKALLDKAKKANDRIISKMNVFNSGGFSRGAPHGPVFPSAYGHRRYW